MLLKASYAIPFELLQCKCARSEKSVVIAQRGREDRRRSPQSLKAIARNGLSRRGQQCFSSSGQSTADHDCFRVENVDESAHCCAKRKPGSCQNCPSSWISLCCRQGHCARIWAPGVRDLPDTVTIDRGANEKGLTGNRPARDISFEAA